jgi:hypothetical protein
MISQTSRPGSSRPLNKDLAIASIASQLVRSWIKTVTCGQGQAGVQGSRTLVRTVQRRRVIM